MTKPIKIKVQESGLPYRREYTENSTTVTIDEYFVKYHYVVDVEQCDAEDLTGPWVNHSNNWRVTYTRANVIGIGIHYVTKLGVWVVTMYVNGSNDELTMNFADGGQAYDIFKQLEDLHIQYVTGKPFAGAAVDS